MSQDAAQSEFATGQGDTQFATAIARIRASGEALQFTAARQQLLRDRCCLELPAVRAEPLAPSRVREHARQAHLRVGWAYQCRDCDAWHLRLAGGYLLTTNGAVATAYHVAEPPRDARHGFFIAADQADQLFPVVEILAANRYADTAILRVRGEGFVPLALTTNAHPGDAVYCLNEPEGYGECFSQGIVERLVTLPERGQAHVPGAPALAPTRILVSADWGRGSSGSAVLDACGNAIGHVSTLAVESNDVSERAAAAGKPKSARQAVHEAASAQSLLKLIKPLDAGTPKLGPHNDKPVPSRSGPSQGR